MPANYAARPTQKPTIEKRRTCSNCGRLGHLVSTCSNHERHHDMIGIEIEGWWWDLIGAQEKARQMCGAVGTRDGSLRDISTCNGNDADDAPEFDDPDTEDCEDGCDDCPHPIERQTSPSCSRGKRDCKACGARGWEFRTKPGSVGEALRQLTSLYPDVTSRAAGMHVHMSFKEKTSISLLCSDAFFKYWQERWEAWGTKNNVKGAFWERLRNENNYCRPTTMEEWEKKALVDQGNGGRYKAINFQSFSNHGTVEFRMLPMFQKGNLAVLAVEQLVDIVETFLQDARLDESVEMSGKIANTPDAPVELDPVINDFEVPVTEFPSVTAEVELPPVFGEIEISGKPFEPGVSDDGTVRIFRYQVDTYLANAAQDATKKKQQLADPKRHSVQWENFNPNPLART